MVLPAKELRLGSLATLRSTAEYQWGGGSRNASNQKIITPQTYGLARTVRKELRHKRPGTSPRRQGLHRQQDQGDRQGTPRYSVPPWPGSGPRPNPGGLIIFHLNLSIMEKTSPEIKKAIRQMNKNSLVTYLKLLGYKPALIQKDFTVFPSPFSDSPGSTLIVNHKTNTFLINYRINRGTVMDLASLLFREAPEDILADIVPYRLDQLISSSTNVTAGQP
jgi:hypothetical protein